MELIQPPPPFTLCFPLDIFEKSLPIISLLNWSILQARTKNWVGGGGGWRNLVIGVKNFDKTVNLHSICSSFRPSPSEKGIPIRVFISSDNGVSVRTHMYKEVEDPRSGEVRSHDMHVCSPR